MWPNLYFRGVSCIVLVKKSIFRCLMLPAVIDETMWNAYFVIVSFLKYYLLNCFTFCLIAGTLFHTCCLNPFSRMIRACLHYRDDIMAAGGLVMQITWVLINRYGIVLECRNYLVSFNSVACMGSNKKDKMESTNSAVVVLVQFSFWFYSSRLPNKVAVTNSIAVMKIASPSWMEVRCGMTLDDSKLIPILKANTALRARLYFCLCLFVRPLL